MSDRACNPVGSTLTPALSLGRRGSWATALFMIFYMTHALAAAPTVIVVQGAAGADEYAPHFTLWRQGWEAAAKAGEAVCLSIGTASEPTDVSDKDALKGLLDKQDAKSNEELWLVLLGHGTFDGKTARFNLRGDDVSADDLASWLQRFDRPIAVINCSSSSGPFMSRLSAANRVIITATRSGSELNYSRFGGFLAAAIADRAADLDKDGQTSLLEAYLLASRQTQEWYKSEGRLATEHALIDDNGDGLGTPAEWFVGVRAVKQAKDGAPLDGLRAKQWCLLRSEAERKLPAEVRAKRDALELKVEELRGKKSTVSEDDYYAQLETLLVELAKLSREMQEQK